MEYDMNYSDLTPAQQARVEEMRRMTPREWDALCKGCGICCLTKVDMGGGVTVYLNRCCAHLDTATRRCRIYNTRLTQRRERCKKVDLDVVLAGNCAGPKIYSRYPHDAGTNCPANTTSKSTFLHLSRRWVRRVL